MSLHRSHPATRPDSVSERRGPVLIGLCGLGLLGLAALMAAPVERLVPVEAPVMAVRALAIVQPAILTVVAILVGLALAGRTGLAAPYLTGTRSVDFSDPILRRDLTAAALVALGAGLVLATYQVGSQVWLAELDPAAARQIAAFSPPLVTRVLYGGLTEEIISRWGVMTFLAWVLGGLHARRVPRPAWVYATAAIVAAALFALGHLPLLLALISDPPMSLIVVVLGLNTAIGTAFGWLFWRRGLETAMLAHALTHLVGAGLVALAPSFGVV